MERPELQLFDLSPSASSSARCHRARQCCDEPHPSLPVPLPDWHLLPGSSLCAGNKAGPRANARSAAVVAGKSWSISVAFPRCQRVRWELSTTSSCHAPWGGAPGLMLELRVMLLSLLLGNEVQSPWCFSSAGPSDGPCPGVRMGRRWRPQPCGTHQPVALSMLGPKNLQPWD